MKTYMTLEEAQERIEQLERENEALKQQVEYLLHNPVPGRRKHDAKWQESYNDFVINYEAGMTIVDIVNLGKISRRTAYRYKAYYEKNCGGKE